MNKKFFKYFFAIIFTILFENSLFAAALSFNQRATFDDGFPADPFGLTSGIEFNKDGTKLFVSYGNPSTSPAPFIINEYNLTVPFDISSKVWAGADERCEIPTANRQIYDLEISKDGMYLLFTYRHKSAGDNDHVFVYKLSSPYDISTCTFHSETNNLASDEFLIGSKAGSTTNPRLQGLEINDDGTKLFLVFSDHHSSTPNVGARLLEYTLSTPFDLTSMSLNKNAGIAISNSTTIGVSNPSGMRFSSDGKKIFITSHSSPRVTQISLNSPYDTSTHKVVGLFDISASGNNQARGIAFSSNGMKMYVSKDRSGGNGDEIFEYDLACPFNVVSGKCELTKDRAALAESKIELAKRTIDYSTKSVINRLKWVRRHKEKENLTNLNMNFHFSDPKFNILSEALKSNVKQISTHTSKKNKNDHEGIFYWSEGNISFGRDGETSLASHKDVNVTSITYGADKVTKNKGLEGIALRFGVDNVDVGSNGSKIDSHTYNFTYYRTFQRDNETSFLDTIIGIGLIESDITSIIGNLEFLNKNRLGKQIYLTLKNSDHIERDGYTIVPAAQFDLGHTKFDAYQERQLNGDGSGGVRFEDQNITSGNMRASLGYFKDLKDEKYIVKSRAKIEYQTEFLIKPDIEYSYISDPSSKYSTDLSPNNGDGLNHIINAEIGLDANIGPYELFVIYEQNRKLNYGYVHNFYVSIGHLPENGTKTSYSIKGSENLITNLNIEKNIENILLSFYLENELENPFTYQQANINLKTTF